MGGETFLYLWIIGIVCLMISMIIHGLKVSKTKEDERKRKRKAADLFTILVLIIIIGAWYFSE